MKKILYFVMIILASTLLLIMSINLLHQYKNYKQYEEEICYYKEEHFVKDGPRDDYTRYYKHYYTEKADFKFIKSYDKIENEENIRKIYSFYDDFKEWMRTVGRHRKI